MARAFNANQPCNSHSQRLQKQALILSGRSEFLPFLQPRSPLIGCLALQSNLAGPVFFSTTRFWPHGPDRRRAPVQPDTIFLTASVTKPVTVTAVIVLVEQGRLLLDDPVYTIILPSLATPTSTTKAAARLC